MNNFLLMTGFNLEVLSILELCPLFVGPTQLCQKVSNFLEARLRFFNKIKLILTPKARNSTTHLTLIFS